MSEPRQVIRCVPDDDGSEASLDRQAARIFGLAQSSMSLAEARDHVTACRAFGVPFDIRVRVPAATLTAVNEGRVTTFDEVMAGVLVSESAKPGPKPGVHELPAVPRARIDHFESLLRTRLGMSRGEAKSRAAWWAGRSTAVFDAEVEALEAVRPVVVSLPIKYTTHESKPPPTVKVVTEADIDERLAGIFGIDTAAADRRFDNFFGTDPNGAA